MYDNALNASDFGLPGVPNTINTLDEWSTFEKAAQASSYETDHAALTGMSALRRESLEPSLRAVIAKSKNFTLLNDLKRTPTTSANQEWNVQTSVGGQWDGMAFNELGEIAFDKGEYERRIERVKLFATGCEITIFANAQTLVSGVDGLRAQENKTGLTRLAGGIERSIIHANESTSPDRINGLIAQIGNYNEGQNVIDFAGESDINRIPDEIFNAKANVRQSPVWGDITRCYTDALVQKDLDKNLFNEFRVHLDENPNSVKYGAPVSHIKTSNGEVEMRELFLANNANNALPYFVLNAGRLPDKHPGRPTATAVPVVGAAKGKSLGWNAQNAGDYWIILTAVDRVGREGQPSEPVAATVAENGAIDVSGAVLLAGDTNATAYRYYRSPRNLAAMPDLSNFRFVSEFKANETYRDVNQNIPGSSHMFFLNFVPDSIDWVQLRPITQHPLAVTSTLTERWAAYMFGTLRLAIPQHHYHGKNYLPTAAKWKPW